VGLTGLRRLSNQRAGGNRLIVYGRQPGDTVCVCFLSAVEPEPRSLRPLPVPRFQRRRAEAASEYQGHVILSIVHRLGKRLVRRGLRGAAVHHKPGVQTIRRLLP